MPPPISSVPLTRTIYTGTFISTPVSASASASAAITTTTTNSGSDTTLRILVDYAVAVDEGGVIVGGVELGGGVGGGGGGGSVEDVNSYAESLWGKGARWEWVRGEEGGWWFPGFVGECF